MKLGILTFQSRQFQNYSAVDELLRAAQKLECDVEVIYAEHLELGVGGKKTTIKHKGKTLPKYDAVLVRPRIMGDPAIPKTVLTEFERAGYRLINRADGFFAAKNKIESLVRMQAAGLPLIPSSIVYNMEEAERAAKKYGFPVVLKVPYRSQGTGVFLAESIPSLRPIADFLVSRGFDDPMVVQKFVKGIKADVRAFVIGNKVVAAAKRHLAPGEFRANQKQGAEMEAVTLTKAQEKLAVKAAKATNLEISGVDLLMTASGTKVVEVNSNPSFEATTHATGIDIATLIVKYAMKVARR